ncbi:mechanosensitive ion channel family protein [Acidianus sp. HS-5]|uniref:mechanosensitive ion channel family protein n=1 Tax=Acidianus sp. HS-5 TaxID=2886040 RepID=UPI001F372C0F|nr:mechanosensitive ion channel family protein [Acidianus sp. HS-5]BDC18167.1 mechanosensitive ion channel protein MscS [Acidianus sp. HS-5]
MLNLQSIWKKQVAKLLSIIVVLAIIAVLLHFLIDFASKYVPSIVPYLDYIYLATDAAIVGVGGYFIIGVLKKIINVYLLGKMEASTARTISFFIDIAFYSILILVVLAALGVNLTGAAIGGAVGGIAIGLAAQTVLSNVLSGALVTGSKTLKAGDPVLLISWIWGSPIVGEATKVGVLFTEVKTTNGNIVKIPNSAFLGNTVFTKLERENSLVYPLQITVNADVPADKVMEKAKNYIKDELNKQKIPYPEIYFATKSGGTNVFTVILHFDNLNLLNSLLNIINSAFDKAYWDTKNESSKA